MIDHEQADKFTNWAQQFAQKPVKGNEGEIETKFVLPLFEHLGYSEGCRRDKFYIRAESQDDGMIKQVSKKEGKAYPDFVYFSTQNRDEQNNNTALVVIEVKKPDENIDRHLTQALKYGRRLHPLFIVLTNGRRIKVLRLRMGSGEESVEDVLVESFSNKDVCLRFYERMNFEIVKRIKDLTVEDLKYEQFLQLDRIINADPELQDVLRTGDFKPHRAENELGLSITKKKVSVSCVLPTGQDEGGCHIEFSNPLRRKLGIHIPFREFRRSMMENLHTPPQWGARRFLREMSGMFRATLGPVTTTLSAVEAEELCECIDEIAERYKSRVIEEETLLETWNYEPVRIQGERAYKLMTVSHPLWDLMKKFADEHDYGKGNSEWHNFIWSGAAIRVGRGAVDHVQLRPISGIGGRESLPNGYIHVLYNIPDWMYLAYDEFSDLKKGLWKESVGPKGIWTANYTKEWLRNKFIPKVLEYYRKDPRVESDNAVVRKESSASDVEPPLQDVQDPKELATYVQDVQLWLSGLARNIASSLVRDYYRCFISLVRNASLAPDKYEYIWGNFNGVARRTRNYASSEDEEIYGVSPEEFSGSDHEKVMQFLDEQVGRVNRENVENSSNAELLSRVFFWILEMGTFRYTQQQINAAKDALRPLWEQQQFEERYINSEV